VAEGKLLGGSPQPSLYMLDFKISFVDHHQIVFERFEGRSHRHMSIHIVDKYRQKTDKMPIVASHPQKGPSFQ